MNFDLDINNYSRDELIQMFELPSKFDKNIVEIKETKLIDSINTNKDIDKNTRLKTINFLNKAKNIILDGDDNNKGKNSDTRLIDTLSNFYNENAGKLKSVELEENTGDHMVQLRKNKPYLESDPGKYFPGTINPLKKRSLQQVLNVDTKFRDNYFTTPSTNCKFNLPVQFSDILEMELSSIEIPNSYYVISKQYGNNFFTIVVNGSSHIIQIPNGNYSTSTIQTAINYELSLAPSPINKIQFDINVSSGGSGSLQTLVGPGPTSSSGVTSLELNFQADITGNYDAGTPLPLKFGWFLGFRNGIYTGNLNYVSEGVADLSGPKYLYLILDDFNNNVNNCFYNAFSSSVLNNNILARISLVGSNSFLIQNNRYLTSTSRQYFGPVNLNTFQVQLVDDYGRIVDLNNMDFSFCLLLNVKHNL
jgi:hypothetical protein